MPYRHTYNVQLIGTCGKAKAAPEVQATVRKSRVYSTSQALPSTLKGLINQAKKLAESQCEALGSSGKLVITDLRSSTRIDPE